MDLRTYIEQFFIRQGTPLPSSWVLSRPKDPSHGHLATNAPFLAKGQSPRETAKNLAEYCLHHPDIVKAEPAGSGFVNITMAPRYWQAYVAKALSAGQQYGKGNFGKGETILLEYLSANPTGPLHAGHARIAVLGDTIAELLSAVGYHVIREYYVNDAGNQIQALGNSVRKRYIEALDGSVLSDGDFGPDEYRGFHVKELGQTLAQAHGTTLKDRPISYFSDYAVEHFCNLFRKDLATLNVKMDNYVSERKDIINQGWVEKSMNMLSPEQLYEGVLEQPKGHDVDDWEPRPQMLFRSTSYGDDQDRALQKSDASWTYFAGDMAYHAYKMSRAGENGHLINIFGADHSGYVQRIKAVVNALGHPLPLEVLVCQMVNFFDKGVPVRMSKRTGAMVSLAEVVEQVGADVTRFVMLWRHHNMSIDFDLAQVVEATNDNPIFYIQYAHARICTVLRHADDIWPGISHKTGDVSALNDPVELAIMQRLSEWPECLQGAALAREPHRLPQYMYNLASDFHSLWAHGKQNRRLRLIDPEDETGTLARLTLIRAVSSVLKIALGILRIEAKESL